MKVFVCPASGESIRASSLARLYVGEPIVDTIGLKGMFSL